MSDETLMRQIARRQTVALGMLHDRYATILKALIMRVVHDEADADDLLQEVFMQVWNQAKHYSERKGKPLGWLVTLTRRRAIDRLRKRQAYLRAKERLQFETDHQPEAWIHDTIQLDIERADLHLFLSGIMRRLPPAQKRAIDLAFFHGMSQREIALKTHTPLGTVKTRLELGLKKMSEALRGIEEKV